MPTVSPFDVLDVFADRSRARRLSGGIGMATLGATSIAAGVILDAGFDRDYGKVFWITGIASMSTSAMYLFLPGPMELVRYKYGRGSVEELHDGWKSLARAARSYRRVNGIMNVGLGGAAIVTGSLFAAGAFDVSEDTRSVVTMATLIAGGAFVARGVVNLMLTTEVEQGFSAAFGGERAHTRAARPVMFGFSPLRGGGMATLSGTL